MEREITKGRLGRIMRLIKWGGVGEYEGDEDKVDNKEGKKKR